LLPSVCKLTCPYAYDAEFCQEDMDIFNL